MDYVKITPEIQREKREKDRNTLINLATEQYHHPYWLKYYRSMHVLYVLLIGMYAFLLLTIDILIPYHILPATAYPAALKSYQSLFITATNSSLQLMSIGITYLILIIIGDCYGFSGYDNEIMNWQRFIDIPMVLLGRSAIVIFTTILACVPSPLSFPFRFVLAFELEYYINLRLRANKAKLEGLRELYEIGKAKQERAASIATGEKRCCAVCKQESLYDLCLTCDKQFQGERHRIRSQILRAKQANVEATLTLPEWLETLNAFHWKCAYCQTGPYELMEHYIPITQGGGTTKENCVPACYSCNSKKSNKHPDFFKKVTR